MHFHTSVRNHLYLSFKSDLKGVSVEEVETDETSRKHPRELVLSFLKPWGQAQDVAKPKIWKDQRLSNLKYGKFKD